MHGGRPSRVRCPAPLSDSGQCARSHLSMLDVSPLLYYGDPLSNLKRCSAAAFAEFERS